MDIGGTNSRFADCYYQSNIDFNIEHIFSINTNQSDIKSFHDLLKSFDSNKPDSFLTSSEYDLISIAIAGPVVGKKAFPPNITWDIDLDDHPALAKTVLLNDFVAQATAFTIPHELEKLDVIREVNKTYSGATAVIGAGTGLGHSILVPVVTQINRYQIIASEAGHACFTFSKDEKELESFILDKINQKLVINDVVVSGYGLSLIHEFLTNQTLSPEEVFVDTNNKTTLNLFSRLYARACRNYCLSSSITDKLIITGGIAAKHPEVVNNEQFIDEFEDSSTHRQILQNISIYLNKLENIGLLGACYFALSS